jgi:creatinine amidohydrolase
MQAKKNKEFRVQFMLPGQLNAELKRVPLIFLPLATLEWHGPHLTVGVDPLNAEMVAQELARRIGGVVLPTLYLGTERERAPQMLRSLGLDTDSHIVGMDFPTIKGLYNSFYFPEEIFALTLRAYIEQCIDHGYRYIYVVNGHGAINHIEVIRRLCIEFSNKAKGVKAAFGTSFPKTLILEGSIAHAGVDETSLMMHYNPEWVDLEALPPQGKKLKYADYAIVDSGGFDGHPGEGHAIPDALDPRTGSNAELGRKLFEQTVTDLADHVRSVFGIRGRSGSKRDK